MTPETVQSSAGQQRPLTFKEELKARRSPELQQAQKRALWFDIATSLWAPITTLGIVFLPYLLLIGLWPSTGAVGQVVMRWFAFAMFLWFVGLIVWRIVRPKDAHRRKVRHESRELIGEISDLLRRVGDKLPAASRAKLLEQAVAVDAARPELKSDRLQGELSRLSDLAEKQLAAWRRNSTLEFFSGFGKALAVALLIRTVFLEPFKIPSGSMIPTLIIGDQVFVNKFIYGVRIPFTNYVPFTIVRPPQRGDVIVFENPLDPTKDFIKRVIGVPGDIVEILDQAIFINGHPIPRREIEGGYTAYGEDAAGGGWYSTQHALFEEELSGRKHFVLQDPRRSRRNQGPYVVPDKHVFVMGDNRDNSSDSRAGFGVLGHEGQTAYVPFGNIKGKALVIWLSLSQGGIGSRILPGEFGLRTDRLFMPVD